VVLGAIAAGALAVIVHRLRRRNDPAEHEDHSVSSPRE
jgi:hypothetical protein